ncbi:MAG TPA: hypothetical protein VH437_01120 [Terriglobales bacterium]|jgi:hypothetical protein
MLTGQALPQATASPSPADKKTVEEFEARVARYLSERRKEGGNAPKQSNSPEKLDQAEQSVTVKSQVSHAGARQGAIFDRGVAEYFRKQIATTLSGPDGSKIRASLQSAEPVQGKLRVDEVYPEKMPLQSTPPTLLLRLPVLPKELEYRIVGNNLVLLDIVPKLVVDYLPDAIPQTRN